MAGNSEDLGMIAKKIGPIALLIPLIAALGGCAKAPPSERDTARVDRMVSEALNKAADNTSDYIRAHPNDAQALARRGLLYLSLDDDRAQVDFDAALRIDPPNATAHYGRAEILADHGQYAQAIAEYDLSIESASGAYNSLNARGLAYWRLGKFDAVIADFDRALAVSSSPLRTSEALENRGIAYDDKKDPDRALQDYDAALQAYPA
jgi:tetratricopeptide (TPR) repeat protein